MIPPPAPPVDVDIAVISTSIVEEDETVAVEAASPGAPGLPLSLIPPAPPVATATALVPVWVVAAVAVAEPPSPGSADDVPAPPAPPVAVAEFAESVLVAAPAVADPPSLPVPPLLPVTVTIDPITGMTGTSETANIRNTLETLFHPWIAGGIWNVTFVLKFICSLLVRRVIQNPAGVSVVRLRMGSACMPEKAIDIKFQPPTSDYLYPFESCK
jgi:hypothetical protein